MRVLLANLRHFYQHRVLMLMGVFYVLLSLTLSAQADGEGALAGLIIVEFAIGVTVAAMQMEVVSKAFSFCLPPHRVVARRFIFLIGLAVSIPLSLLFSRCPGQAGMTLNWSALVLPSTLSAGMMAYLSGIGIGSCVRIPVSILVFAPLIVIGGVLLELHVRIESIVIHAPVFVIAAGMISGMVGWLWLGRSAWFRHRCTRLWIGFSDLDDLSKMDQHCQARASPRAKTRIHPRIDGFFLGMMTSHTRSERLRYVWGALYATVLQVVPSWKRHLFTLVMLLVLAGYIPRVIPFVAGVYPAMIISFLPAPLPLKSLVVAGRRERFRGTILLLIVLGSTAALIIVFLAAISNLIALLVPEVRAGDFTFRFRAISFRSVWYPIIVFPIVSVLHILSSIIKPVLLDVLAMLLAFPLIVYFMFFPMTSPIYVLGCVALSWIFCFLVVYQITMRSDLGRK